MPFFQPNNKPLSLSKLFHCFWPHTVTATNLRAWDPQSEPTHCWPSHNQKPDQKHKFIGIQNHKHKFGPTHTRSTNTNLIQSITKICRESAREREREREELNHTQPKPKPNLNRDPKKTQFREREREREELIIHNHNPTRIWIRT